MSMIVKAGIFRHGEGTSKNNTDVEERDAAHGVGIGNSIRREDVTEISSENSALVRSYDDIEFADDQQDDDVEDDKNKKRKKYHRHTLDQIREMEALFKESPHPDDKQREELGKKLGLHPSQVKFWFQNRRTQIKTTQERRGNLFLRREMIRFRDENKALSDIITKSACSNCGAPASAKHTVIPSEFQQLWIENARLKSESQIVGIVNKSIEELIKMATEGEPLWIKSFETGREVLNYEEYLKDCSVENFARKWPNGSSIEASRDSGVVLLDLPTLVQYFMDAMFAELQMPTPLVTTRRVYFFRHCKQVTADKWAIVDVSIDKLESNIDERCYKRPSGCIIEDTLNGHIKVIWVEHMECHKSLVPSLYRRIVNSGLAFGAGRWLKMLQLQCERLVSFTATNVHTNNSYGVFTLAGRKSILELAQRMTTSFYRALGASNYHTWNTATSKTGEDIRIAWRKNLSDPKEPLGVVLCAVLSVWLPVSRQNLFNFLRDETRRNEWQTIVNKGPVRNIANLVKGQDQRNAVTIQAMKQNRKSVRILQDCCTNAFESTVVYAPVDISSMQSAMQGCDTSDIAILPSGFSIIPDGVESGPLLLSSGTEGGSLLTIAFQILTSNSPTENLSMESFKPVNKLVSCTLQNIKTALRC
ncbi:hypothetical protein DCAR_0730242 [Daucus carota subsp. sativus]|uniref:Uncharacterized protein n=1 Tax=Daucus carota subsp. sativus TaxID=79200 RepID=A0AAF0XPB7_DAUCS|nr:hypothetical protein DCAR_0730242 [Daucus carota subsp. sativus]